MKRSELRIVVIDDNADATQTLGTLLQRTGYQVVGMICDPGLALDCIKRERPHVAILDIAMPQIDGYDLAREIRAEADWLIKLIAVTALGRDYDKADAVGAGFDAHFTKPVDWPALTQLLDRYLDTKSGMSDWLLP